MSGVAPPQDVATRLPDARETRLEGDSTKGSQTDSARLRRLAPHGEQNYSPCRACQAIAKVAAARTVVLAMSPTRRDVISNHQPSCSSRVAVPGIGVPM